MDDIKKEEKRTKIDRSVQAFPMVLSALPTIKGANNVIAINEQSPWSGELTNSAFTNQNGLTAMLWNRTRDAEQANVNLHEENAKM